MGIPIETNTALRRPTGTAAIAAALSLLASVAIATPPTWTGKVIAVADGDTVTVFNGATKTKVRLHGIDTPESQQAFGRRAKEYTTKACLGKSVTVKPVTIDKYGRLVAEILVEGKSVNKAIVKAGYGWWFRKYSPKDRELAALEAEARKAKRGLWIDKRPQPPWEWRKLKRQEHQDASKASPKVDKAHDYRGNAKSKVLHHRRCGDFACRNCTASFATVILGKTAGYRPHRACVYGN